MSAVAMKFGSHYLPTYVPDLDGSVSEFYQKMFAQMEEMDRLGYDHIWVTEHHFAHYGGDLPHPPTFLSAIARTTKRIRLGVAISVSPLHNPLMLAESYAMTRQQRADFLQAGTRRRDNSYGSARQHICKAEGDVIEDRRPRAGTH
jgi:hypothetical protein